MILALLVSLAGGLGAAARYGVDGLIRDRVSSSNPWGTAVVNITGSLALGILTGLVAASLVSEPLRVVAGVGFLGGYTTFSTASVETVRLAQQRRPVAAVVHGVGMVVASVIAAGLGWMIGSRE